MFPNPFASLKQGTTALIAALALLLALGFAAAFIFQTVRLDGFLWIDGVRDQLAEREKTISDMRKASAANLAKAEAQRVATEAAYANLARRADNAEAANAQLRAENTRLRGLSDRFAAHRSVRSLRDRICSAAATAEDRPASDRDGPGPDELADAVVLTRPEYEELVAYAFRLKAVSDWGQSLIDQKLAITLVGFGQAAPAEGAETDTAAQQLQNDKDN